MPTQIKKTMRYQFNEVFTENKDGTLSPIKKIRVGGVSFGPGVSFGSSAAFGGINFFQYKGHELEADEENGILVIKAIY
ncbi:hypothetical protein HZA40_03730 [Candidatus Peregrinibacteria bacterium]|nr:hypothetical protein [Candidatus Peregrinibacteria bacterium]